MNPSYIAGKESLNKALRLLQSNKGTNKRKANELNEKDKPDRQCPINFINEKKKYVAMTYSPHFAILEMRLCLLRHDWMNLQKLFPLLFSITIDKEPVVWRYALIILLYSPASSIDHVVEFFTRCIGNHENFKFCLAELIKLESHSK